jgi:hypothetical protein
MKTLPVRPVDVLALAPTTPQPPTRTTQVIPPWLQPIKPMQPANTGIVPPWLLADDQPVAPTDPVGDDDPRIFAVTLLA